MLEPALGPNSVLTLDDEPAPAPAQAAAAALPRRAGRALRRADPRGHPPRDGELAGRRAVRAAPPHPADHPGGDHARRLRRPRRRSGWRASSGLIDEFARRVGLVASFPLLRRDLGRLSPWGRFLRSRQALDAFIYEEIAPAPGRGRATEERDDVLSLLLGARDEDGSPMSDARTARRAGHGARRRPRDDRDRARLGGRAARRTTPPCWRSCATRSPPARRTTSTRRSRRRCARGR